MGTVVSQNSGTTICTARESMARSELLFDYDEVPNYGLHTGQKLFKQDQTMPLIKYQLSRLYFSRKSKNHAGFPVFCHIIHTANAHF